MGLLLAFGLLTGVEGCQTATTQVAQSKEKIYGYSLLKQDEPGKKPAKDPEKPTVGMLLAAADYRSIESNNKTDAPLVQEEMRNEARRDYQKALQMDPKCLRAYQGLARLYLTMGDDQHAISTYQKALEVSPKNPQFWYDLGMCQCRQKEFDAGVVSLGKAVSLDPENRQYVNAQGYTLARMGRFDESLDCFTRVNGRARAHLNLALMLQHLNKTDLAREHLQQALQLDPKLETQVRQVAQMADEQDREIQTVSYETSSPSVSEGVVTIPTQETAANPSASAGSGPPAIQQPLPPNLLHVDSQPMPAPPAQDNARYEIPPPPPVRSNLPLTPLSPP
jgi:Tfp pilus assembly protein PilF